MYDSAGLHVLFPQYIVLCIQDLEKKGQETTCNWYISWD
jgi:hypothetical protein